jgi:hypothetical protein
MVLRLWTALLLLLPRLRLRLLTVFLLGRVTPKPTLTRGRNPPLLSGDSMLRTYALQKAAHAEKNKPKTNAAGVERVSVVVAPIEQLTPVEIKGTAPNTEQVGE